MNMTAIFIVNLNWLISPGLFCVVFLLEFRFLIYSNISYLKECRSWIFNGMLFCLLHVFLCHLGCIYMVLSFERNEVNLFSIIPINIGGQYIISSPSIPGGGMIPGFIPPSKFRNPIRRYLIFRFDLLSALLLVNWFSIVC